MPPDYDNDLIISWQRPGDLVKKPCYFSDEFKYPRVLTGTLQNYTFIGALMVVCAYGQYDLMENIFASNPEDFNPYGVYTCRFYVDGEWFEVLTDTLLPCRRDDSTGYLVPCYNRSNVNNEFWIPLVEKAYAKAVGSYESILKIKPHDALLHLTGGSVQEVLINDHQLSEQSTSKKMIEQMKWNSFKNNFELHTLVVALGGNTEAEKGTSAQKDTVEEKKEECKVDLLATAAGDSVGDDESTGTGLWEDASSAVKSQGETQGEDLDEHDELKLMEVLIPDRLYYVQCFKEIGPHRLVLVTSSSLCPLY